MWKGGVMKGAEKSEEEKNNNRSGRKGEKKRSGLHNENVNDKGRGKMRVNGCTEEWVMRQMSKKPRRKKNECERKGYGKKRWVMRGLGVRGE